MGISACQPNAAAQVVPLKAATSTGRVASKHKGFKSSAVLAAMRAQTNTHSHIERRELSNVISKTLRNDLASGAAQAYGMAQGRKHIGGSSVFT